MSDRPLDDHPFCQQVQEPDLIDMMDEGELRAELRELVKNHIRLQARNEKLEVVLKHSKHLLDGGGNVAVYYFEQVMKAIAGCEDKT